MTKRLGVVSKATVTNRPLECAHVLGPLLRDLGADSVEDAQGFKPRGLTIKAGDCVHWTNRINIEHRAVAVDRSFPTGQLMPGNANVVKFEKLGEVAYTCGPHPPMVGKIIVTP